MTRPEVARVMFAAAFTLGFFCWPAVCRMWWRTLEDPVRSLAVSLLLVGLFATLAVSGLGVVAEPPTPTVVTP